MSEPKPVDVYSEAWASGQLTPFFVDGRQFDSQAQYAEYLASREPAQGGDERAELIRKLKKAGQTVGGNTSIEKLREKVAELEA